MFLGKTLNSVPLSTQEYQWVPANCWGNLTNRGEVTCDGLASHPGGEEYSKLLHATKTGISSGSYEPVGSKASLVSAECTIGMVWGVGLAKALWQ